MLSSSSLSSLKEAHPLLARGFLPKWGEEDAIELVLRDALAATDFKEALDSLCALSGKGITSVLFYKEFLVNLSAAQQETIYSTLGASIGPQLTELSLSFLKITVVSLSSLLRSLPLLKSLHLSRVSFLHRAQASQLYSALQNLMCLEDFHLSLAPAEASDLPLFQSEFASDSMDSLVQSLSKIPTIETVYLAAHRPRAGRIVLPATFRALAESKSLTTLTLLHFPLQADHGRALLSSRPCRLTSLALLQADLGDMGAQVIVEEVLKNPESKLQKLYLPGNGFTDIGGVALARALTNPSSSSSLQVLDLHDNRLTSRFGKAMAESLALPSSPLTFLDVSYNPLTDIGGIAISHALHSNTKLQQLHLYQNQISDRTCTALAAALKRNRNLKQINLYNNPRISTEGVDSLLHNLEHENYVVERLEVSLSDSMTTPTVTKPTSRNNKMKQKETQAQLDFLLTLNRKFGRRDLLKESTTDAEYLDKGLGQATTANDLNSLFYFLKAKPTLFQTNANNNETMAFTPTVSNEELRRHTAETLKAVHNACDSILGDLDDTF